MLPLLTNSFTYQNLIKIKWSKAKTKILLKQSQQHLPIKKFKIVFLCKFPPASWISCSYSGILAANFRAADKNIFHRLTLSWGRPISYRNQSIDLRSKSVDWFLYDIGVRHERVKWFLCLIASIWRYVYPLSTGEVFGGVQKCIWKS